MEMALKPFSYNDEIVRTLLHRDLKIRSSWFLFHEAVVEIKHYLEKNYNPLSFVDKQSSFLWIKQIRKVLHLMLQTQLLSTIKYLKLCHISTDLKSKINRFCKFYCKNLNIKVPLTPFKVADIFNVKDPVPKSEKAFVVHKFVSPGCNACNSGETTRHLSTKIK